MCLNCEIWQVIIHEFDQYTSLTQHELFIWYSWEPHPRL